MTGVVETHSLLFADKLRQKVLVHVRQLILSEDFSTAEPSIDGEVGLVVFELLHSIFFALFSQE